MSMSIISGHMCIFARMRSIGCFLLTIKPVFNFLVVIKFPSRVTLFVVYSINLRLVSTAWIVKDKILIGCTVCRTVALESGAMKRY